MADDHSIPSTPNSGTPMEPPRVTSDSPPASSSVDMLALGFGVLCLDSSPDNTHQVNKVSALVWRHQIGVVTKVIVSFKFYLNPLFILPNITLCHRRYNSATYPTSS